MPAQNRFDFGYSWVWSYGHLVAATLFAISTAIASVAGASPWLYAPSAAIALWAFAGFLIARLLLRVNDPLRLPTSQFLPRGAGRVLDLGCGSGRTSIMVGTARSNANITGLDNFSADYIAGHGTDKTLRNFAVAGIEGRADIQTGNMLDLPFENETFDAAVSSYAIDHLEPSDISVALAETRRVLQPNGDLLLMVIVPNIWTAIAFTPLVYLRLARRSFWRSTTTAVGFAPIAEGSSRGAAWFLLRNEGTPVADRNPATPVVAAAPASPTRGHNFSVRGMLVPVALTAVAILAVAIALRLLGVYTSWWWVAAALPIGMHLGLPILLFAGLLRVGKFAKGRAKHPAQQ